ncbi:hypothetical protein [Pseudomonas sp. LRF_L74]|uniref:hypothetical protein n=1 Tax=Pseudomonas sp. LRF_L74 TaxID=3369422 RepID=UPI003F610CAB
MTTLRVNEALLIAGGAFQPFQCIAWSQQQDGSGELTLTVIDRTSTRVGSTNIDSSACRDPKQLASALLKSREQLSLQGYRLEPWSMPE